MIVRSKTPRSGFTLVELAIVLAVTAVLFTGVYRLLTSGNQQVKDSSVATQQSQLISSTKSFLSSQPGQELLQNYVCGGSCGAPPINKPLPLPSSANPAGSTNCPNDPNLAVIVTYATAWCNALPSGFSADKTVNSYGQTYQIAVQADSTSTNAGPATYSFMILTTGGNVIPDTDGGRISSLIGADGGFVYTNQASCNPSAPPPFIACGSYGAWTVDPHTFGLPTQAAGGVVASRTYVSVDQEANLPWLARINVPGDANHVFNTLAQAVAPTTTDLWLNANVVGNAALNSVHGTNTSDANGKTGYGGIIDTLNQLIAGNDSTDIDIPPGSYPAPDSENPPIAVSGPFDSTDGTHTKHCSATQFAQWTGGGGLNGKYIPETAGGNYCHEALHVNGGIVVTGMTEANILWASSFIYGSTTSDLRLKKDIKPLGDALSDVMKLKPVTFRYKQDNKPQIGFIAQDIQKVYPQMVVGRPDNVLGVDYMQMFAPLVSSVQELKKENDQLRKQLESQAAEIKSLQNHTLDSP